ncbi:HEAT repeat domain-containing protein [bacterium]|nr:HEAT repeat domain-containing protein [bacterium]
MRRIISLIAFFLLVMVALAQDFTPDNFPPAIDEFSRAKIDSMLDFSGLTRTDAEFEKKWASDTLFQLKIVKRMLDKPFELPDTLDSWTRLALDNSEHPGNNIKWAFSLIDAKLSSKTISKFEKQIYRIAAKDRTGEEIAEPYRTAIRYLLASFDIASEHTERMMEKLPPASRDSLLYLLPTFWTDSEDTLDDSLSIYLLELVSSDFDTSNEVALDSLYEAMYNFSLEELGLATQAVILGVNMATKAMTETSKPVEMPTELITRWGKAIIGCNSTDIFEDAQIILDPGGDDIYNGLHAAGRVGSKPFGVVIDIAGNDFYDGRSEIFNQASGVFGVGYLRDIEGDDTYRCTHYGQGSGLFGAGILIDEAGDDNYSGGVFVQGAGNFGVGALIEGDGEDSYRSYCHAQAFAGPKGCGLLNDHGGSDQYFSGGKYSHAPLAPFDYHSFAQGFAIGWRPDVSGGVGFLFDKEGNDTYTTGVYGQGVSYWYSIAALIDNAGNDVYTSVWYPQGSGIHLSVGALIDRAGNDIYVSPQGPGQGSAHDYSVGFFSEYRGNDIYVIDGGNGTSLTNSFVLFLDRNGDDLYAKRRLTSSNWGYARGARGTGSMGLFLDIEGTDHYSDITLAGNNKRWFTGDIGFGMDISGEKFPDPVKELAEELAEEEPDSDRTIESIFNDASLWGVGSAKDKSDKAFQELLDSGQVSADYICEKQLDTKSSLRTRTIQRFCEKKPELIKPCLYATLHDNDNIRRRGSAIYFLGEIKDEEAVDSLLPFLKIKRTRIGTISALGKIKSKDAVPQIMKWATDKKQAVRYMVAKALASIEDERAIPTLLKALNDDYLTVRLAAQYGIVNMREQAFDVALEELDNLEKPAIYHILRVIQSSCKKFEADTTLEKVVIETRLSAARGAVLKLLDSNDPIIRGHAVKCLGSLGGKETIAEMRRRFELETDPFVRSMFEQALKNK